MMKDVSFTPQEVEYLENLLANDIQVLYDDPGNVPLVLRGVLRTQRSLCTKLGLDYEKMVEEEATPFEVERVAQILIDDFKGDP
jgi:hypothetical protein